MHNSDDLPRMAVFAAVVEAGSFTAAAERLGLTKSAVSRSVRVLEGRYAVRLLNRTTRSMALTEAGQAFYGRCAQVVETASDALASLAETGGDLRGTLSISTSIGIGESIVAPGLAAFLRRYPHMRVSVRVSDRMVDLVSERVDVAVRAGELSDSSLICRKLTEVPLLVCAAPAYLDRRGRPSHPDELSTHDWVVFEPLGNPQRLQLQGDGELATVKVSSRVVVDNGPLLHRLLLSGLGMGVLPHFYIEDDLRAGRLEVVLADWAPPRAGVYAVYASARHLPMKVRAFVDCLVEDG